MPTCVKGTLNTTDWHTLKLWHVFEQRWIMIIISQSLSPSFFMSTGLLQNKDPRSFPYKQSSHVRKRVPSPDCRSSAPPQKHTETLVKFGKKLVLHGFAGIHFVDSIQYLKNSLSGQKRSRVFFAFFWFNAHHSNKPTARLGQWLLTYFMFFANESEKRDMPPHRMEKLLDVLLKASIGNFFEHLLYIKKFEASLPAQQLPFQTCGPWASLMLA